MSGLCEKCKKNPKDCNAGTVVTGEPKIPDIDSGDVIVCDGFEMRFLFSDFIPENAPEVWMKEHLSSEDINTYMCSESYSKYQKAKKERQVAFDEVVKPVIKFLNDHCHPHCHIVIDSTKAELSEGIQSVVTLEYVKD